MNSCFAGLKSTVLDVRCPYYGGVGKERFDYRCLYLKQSRACTSK